MVLSFIEGDEMEKIRPTPGAVVPSGTSDQYIKTGTWRFERPVIDNKKCIRCFLCWIFCPDTSIVILDEKILVDLDFCKGCGICAHECPVEAIKMEEERR
jgi:pyruvate ferredoxin oxidoreductase delta subunit